MTPTQQQLIEQRKQRQARMAQASADYFDRCYEDAQPKPVAECAMVALVEVIPELPATIPESANPTMRDIQNAVCTHYKISRNELNSVRRNARLVRPRQVAFFLCRELTTRSFPEIGRMFGGRDHTTVLYAVRKIDVNIEDYLAEIDALREALR